MASAFPGQVTAVQVGSYFLGQYYPFLQQTPNLVHQFYTNESTMIRYDGDTNESASGMAEIHNLIVGLNLTEIEIKTAHSLESWNGGVLVTVTGFMHAKDFICRRKFVETFFLAPQEKGYFVLNDIFLLLEEEQVQHPVAMLTPNDYDTKLDALDHVQEPDSFYGCNSPDQLQLHHNIITPSSTTWSSVVLADEYSAAAAVLKHHGIQSSMQQLSTSPPTTSTSGCAGLILSGLLHYRHHNNPHRSQTNLGPSFSECLNLVSCEVMRGN